MSSKKKSYKKKSLSDRITDLIAYGFIILFPCYIIYATYSFFSDLFGTSNEPTTIEKVEDIIDEGRVWKVADVPNSRLQSNYIHVCNPDSIIETAYEDSINALLAPFKNRSDIFVVALNKVESPTIFDFSHELFNTWGIGDAEKNNGILVAMTMRPHAIFITTGDGMEGDVPDVVCHQIIEKSIKPYFRKDEYGKGLYECSKALVSHINRNDSIENQLVPGSENNVSSASNNGYSYQNSTEYDDEDLSFFMIILVFAGLWYIFISPCIGIFIAVSYLLRIGSVYKKSKKEAYYDRNRMAYLRARDLKPTSKDNSVAILFPIILLAYIPMWYLYKKNRKKVRICPHCGSKMNCLSESEEDAYMSPQQILEEREQVFDYDVWYCKNCHHTIVGGYQSKRYDRYSECEKCHTRLSKEISRKTILEPTYSSEGMKNVVYKCLYCNHQRVTTYRIPKLEKTVVVSGGGGYSGGGGGFSGGGSFGGGHSSGGGAGGSW